MIFSKSWIKKHKVIIDITNNFLIFWPNYYIYIRASFSTTLSQPIFPIKTTIVKIKKKYHDFFYIFSKKNSDILSLHKKYEKKFNVVLIIKDSILS